MELYIDRFKKNLGKNIALAVFFVLYLVLFWFMFFTKGVYVNDSFYKKSANINTITYTTFSQKENMPKTIVLKKHFDGSGLLEFDSGSVTVSLDKSINYQGDFKYNNISEQELISLALQTQESYRGHNSYNWIFVIAIYALFFLSKHFSVAVYGFFYKNRAAGEGYYKVFNIIFELACVAGLVYLLISM